MNFMERVIGIVTRPEETIKDILKEPRLEEALVIVGIYTIILFVSSYFTSQHLVQQGASGLNLIAIAISIIWPFVGWLIATVVVHLFSVVLGGKGKLVPDMLTAIGFSYIPKIPFAIIAMVLIMLMPVIVLPVIDPATQNPAAIRPLAEAMAAFYYNPLFLGSLLAGIIGLIWSCYVGMLAAKNGESLSMNEAAIAVGVPMVIYIIVFLAFTFGTLYMLQAFT